MNTRLDEIPLKSRERDISTQKETSLTSLSARTSRVCSEEPLKHIVAVWRRKGSLEAVSDRGS